MNKKHCIDNRDTCGTITMSSCVPYTGEDLTSIDNENLPCNPNINDIVKEIDIVIKDIQTAINVTDLDLSCLDSCICKDLSIKELFELLKTKLCELTDRVKILEAVDISTTKFKVDLQCFNNPCFNSSDNEYSLLEIISLLLTELCTLKNQA
jgi:hypothetical protein